MPNEMKKPTAARLTGEPLRQQIIDAAEKLLRDGKAEFSMRDLAAEAGVSFATPFNQFGSKAAIMHAMCGRRFALMQARFEAAPPVGDALDRVMQAVDVVAAVMLEEPVVNRTVMTWIGTAGPTPSQVLERSKALFSMALSDGIGFAPEKRDEALMTLPVHITFGFRGVLSFWTAGEISDAQLATCARELVLAMVLKYAETARP